MDEQRFENVWRELLKRSRPDQVFAIGELVRQMGQQVPADAGRGQVRGRRGDGAPRRKSGPKKKVAPGPRIRLWPTNSARENRAQDELSLPAYKIHGLLWRWRGAPARGLLPYFTVVSLGKICHLDPKTARKGIGELIRKHFIRVMKYDKHHKNTLYKLVPVREMPPPRDVPRIRREFEAESEAG